MKMATAIINIHPRQKLTQSMLTSLKVFVLHQRAENASLQTFPILTRQTIVSVGMMQAVNGTSNVKILYIVTPLATCCQCTPLLHACTQVYAPMRLFSSVRASPHIRSSFSLFCFFQPFFLFNLGMRLKGCVILRLAVLRGEHKRSR